MRAAIVTIFALLWSGAGTWSLIFSSPLDGLRRRFGPGAATLMLLGLWAVWLAGVAVLAIEVFRMW